MMPDIERLVDELMDDCAWHRDESMKDSRAALLAEFARLLEKIEEVREQTNSNYRPGGR